MLIHETVQALFAFCGNYFMLAVMSNSLYLRLDIQILKKKKKKFTIRCIDINLRLNERRAKHNQVYKCVNVH